MNVIVPSWRLQEGGLDEVARLVAAAARELTAAYAATRCPEV